MASRPASLADAVDAANADSAEENPTSTRAESDSLGEASAPVTDDADFVLLGMTSADARQLRSDLGRARKEVKQQRLRADEAEKKCDRVLLYTASLKKELSAAAGRAQGLQADVALLMREKKAAAVLSAQLEKAKAAALRDHTLAAEAGAKARAEVEHLRQQLLANGIQPPTPTAGAEERDAGDSRCTKSRQAPGEEAAEWELAAVKAAVAATEAADGAGSRRTKAKKAAKKASAQAAAKGRAGAAAEKMAESAMPLTAEAAPVAPAAKPAADVADMAGAALPPTPRRLAAQKLLAQKAVLDEHQRLAERRLQEMRRREEEEEREQEERERQLQIEEDEAREARKLQQRVEKERMAKAEATERAQKARERAQRQQECERRLLQERATLPPEDFAALQAMRAELGEDEPEKEESPDENDEDALLDKEIERVKEEQRVAKKMPTSLAELVLEMEGMPAPPPEFQEQAKKAQQAKHRAALKEKLQTRRELETMLGSGAAPGRRARR